MAGRQRFPIIYNILLCSHEEEGASMPEIYDVVIVGSGAGGGMAAFMLTQAGASVAVVEAGGHNIDRDIRHHEWPWELAIP
jgi:NADPH-dependent 2,4-dienoyl-CoA reductase/sulfur reductase-like enzyme